MSQTDHTLDEHIQRHQNAFVDPQNVSTYLDIPYLRVLRDILDYGERHDDRTGVGTRSLFGVVCKYDLRERFPLLTCRRVPWKWTVLELMWFLSGSTNAGDLEKHGVKWWSSWGDQVTRDLGPVYGAQWKDQWPALLASLSEQPLSRRHVVTLWDPATVDQCALPPCHGVAIQFKLSTDDRGVPRLHSMMFQRSADWILGVPVNIASYALLTCALAYRFGWAPGFFTHAIGDAHVYSNHIDVGRELLERPLRESPQLDPKHLQGFWQCMNDSPWDRQLNNGMWHPLFFASDAFLGGYLPHPPIEAKVAV